MTQIKMIRVYETVFEFNTDDVQQALSQFGRIPDCEVHSVELEQCCVTEIAILLPGEEVTFSTFEN